MSVCYFPSSSTEISLEELRCYLLAYFYAKKYSKKYTIVIKGDDNCNVIRDLKWFGIDNDCGPYYQMHNTYCYDQTLKMLIQSGFAYYDYSTGFEFQKEMAKHQGDENLFAYSRKWALSDSEVKRQIQLKQWTKRNTRRSCVRLKSPRNGDYQFDQVILDSENNYSDWYKQVVDCMTYNISCAFRSSWMYDYSFYQAYVCSALNYPPPIFMKIDPLYTLAYNSDEVISFIKECKDNCEALGIPLLSKSKNTIGFYKHIGFMPLVLMNYVVLKDFKKFSLEDFIQDFQEEWFILDNKNSSLDDIAAQQEYYLHKHLSPFQQCIHFKSFISRALGVYWDDSPPDECVKKVNDIKNLILVGSDYVKLKS